MKRPQWLFWACFVVWLIVDIITKALVVESLLGNPPIVIIPNFFQLIYHINTGVAFGMFSHPPYNKFLPFLVLGLFAWMIWYARTLSWEKRVVNVGAALVAAGAIGNMIDRFKQGYVVDFLDFNFWGYSYPTFNVADSGICIGLGLVLLFEWKKWKYEQITARNLRTKKEEECRHSSS